jgi:hypothetical protein
MLYLILDQKAGDSLQLAQDEQIHSPRPFFANPSNLAKRIAMEWRPCLETG